MDSKSINDEHKNLKHLLRDFNAETYEILGKYIDKPLEPSRKKSKTSNHTVI